MKVWRDILAELILSLAIKVGTSDFAKSLLAMGKAHYKKLGLDKAWCGIKPAVSYDDWTRVTCPDCRALHR